MVRVELDRKALFALASDTRMDILKALQSDRRTVSQLAELLQVDKAAVHRHLKKLEEGEFVNRVEDHGFIYYSLSWKARDIVSPGENTRIIVLISSALLMLMVGALILFAVQSASNTIEKANSGAEDSFSAKDPLTGLETADRTIDYMIVSGLAIIGSILLFTAYRKVWRPYQPNAEGSEKSNVIGRDDDLD